MSEIPAFVTNGRLDALYANPLNSELFRDRVRPVNSARFLFLDPRARTFYADWEQTARESSPPCIARPGATCTTAACPT